MSQAQLTPQHAAQNGGYAHPEVLVSTAWVAENANQSGIRVVEVDVDTAAYQQGHRLELDDAAL
jgi:hypothetical protein